MEGVNDYHKTSIVIIVSQENITNADYTVPPKLPNKYFRVYRCKNAASFLHSDFDF